MGLHSACIVALLFLATGQSFLAPTISCRCGSSLRSPSTVQIYPHPTWQRRSEEYALKKRKEEGGEEVAKRGVVEITKEIFGAVWRAIVVIVAISSVALAVDAIIKLRTQPITIDNAMSTAKSLLPLTAFGVAGAARVVAFVLRITRVLITIPILAGGAYFIAPSVSDLVAHKPELMSGGLLALLATPEVIEALIFLAVCSGFILWIFQILFNLLQKVAELSIGRGEGDEK